MTTNIERATEIVRDGLAQAWNAGPIFDTRKFPDAAAEALADAGLLIPHAHIPEPSYCVQEFGDIYLGQSLEWEDYGISIVFGKRVGGDKGPELFAEGQEFSNSENVITYAAYLLEAAKRMKEIEDLEKYGI